MIFKPIDKKYSFNQCVNILIMSFNLNYSIVGMGICGYGYYDTCTYLVNMRV